METKPFWTSKTLWANIVMGTATVGTAFGWDLGLDPATQVAVVGGIMGVTNLILRFMTKSAVSVTKTRSIM